MLLVIIFITAPFLFLNAASAAPQSSRTNGPLLITPSSAVFLVGDYGFLSAVDETGRPVSDVEWSIDPPLADLRNENGAAFITASEPGHAILTAKANNQVATAIIDVAPGKRLPAASVLWSLLPTPGYETLLVNPAAPASDAPAFYSIEWNKSSNAIVRAISVFGQQLWTARLASTASPLTLKNVLPPAGEVFQDETLLSDHSQFIIGDKTAFAVNNSTDPSRYGLPPDGQTILVRTAGDSSGGLLLLERGRFRDFLVDLSPADGSELWRFHSAGRLLNDLTVNFDGDVGIVETLAKPPSSALLVLNGKTGQVSFRIPFPVSSSTIDGAPCAAPGRNRLKSIRPSLSGSLLTSTDGKIYVQAETHVESLNVVDCKKKEYSFDDSLALLSVTPEGEFEWKTLQHIHADDNGNFVVQPRVFAGETIPDGFDGVLVAWTYAFPGSPDGEKPRFEARLSRIGPSGQQDFTLPMPFWTKGINSFFDENMVLGDQNILYATNGPLLLRFDAQAGAVNWVRHPPTGDVKLQHATSGGGVLVANAGCLSYFDAEGNGQVVPWTVRSVDPDGIGLAQFDLFDHNRQKPLQLRQLQIYAGEKFIAVEDGAPYGRGTLLYFQVQ